MNKTLLNIGLTGSRYSGKNSVCKLFRQIGVPVFDADAVIKYILNYRISLCHSVRSVFGSEYVLGNYINPTAFDTDAKIEKLIDLIEFEVFEAYNNFRLKHSEKQYTIFHSSIIFERKWESKFDKIVTVFAPKEDRIYRYREDTCYKLDTIHSLLAKEMNEIEKNQRSDFIIHNYIDAPNVVQQLSNIDDKIVDYYIEKNNKKNATEVY